ncbi:MAG TPA: aldehyde dehydrogenase family protein [Candidatus Acidoferrales bacterium]|nr:aldehyde dehydrogenase family protein [Candidatus Acidoferrales bacterium]
MNTQAQPSARVWPFLAGGKWISEGSRAEIRSPYDGSVAGIVCHAEAGAAEGAVVAAERALAATRTLPSHERRRILREISAAIQARREEFARLMALEAGKPIRTARAEVDRAVFTFSVAAEETGRAGGEWLPLDWQPSGEGRAGIVRRFALGPVLAITPFNFPLNLVAHKVAPAIAAGCPLIVKPAPQAPLCALLLAELVMQSGWPAGALSVLPLANEDAERLVRDDRLKMLTFTGSATVGWALKAKAGKKKVVLELGGNAGVIVHSDADIADAARRCVQGGFSYAGQSCISVQRIFVQQRVAAEFTAALVERVKLLKCGDPLDEATDVGPMITEAAARRAEQWIAEAVAGGGRLLTGGGRNGAVLAPAVLTHTRPEMKVNCEEVFAPVVMIEPCDEFADAIRRVNDSPYGLQAGVFTRDAKLLFQAFERLEVGGVIAGDASAFRMDHMPYGGIKDSGLGREGLRYAIEEMTEPRLLVLNLAEPR